MKSILYLLLILTMTVLGSHRASAQVGGEGRMGNGGGYWIFGLNAGGAWQDSDIQSLAGGGWGFYIGHSIFNQPNSFLSADLRFRYMNTYTYGQNHRDQLFGNTVLADSFAFSYRPASKAFAHNHETNFHDLSLELRVNFEQLRRRHKIWLSLYGGIGLGIYGTRFNQRDLSGNEYDYESIDYSQDDEDICRDIIALQDDTYETFAYEDDAFKLTATPTVGIELGYWFTPHFALGIGHRTTFTLQDDFEGVKINNGAAINSAIHHYTSLMLHWRVVGKKSVPCPEVKFQLPIGNGQTYNTSESSVFVKASVSNVSQNQITYSVNGQSSTKYSYDEGDDVFQGNVVLQEGQNTIVLKAKNACGTDVQAIKVNYTPKVVDSKQPPIVRITNPSSSPTTVNQSMVNISANIQYVTGKNNVTFTVNGGNSQNFTFNGRNFQANNVALVKGSNTIRVKGVNQDGQDSKTVVINYTPDEPQQPPVVTIMNPGQNPLNTTNPNASINASILNVANAANVRYTINGQVSNNFSFNGTNFTSSVTLVQGSNTFTITGTNSAGQDSKTTVIIYKPIPQPPVVTITTPQSSPYNTQNSSETVRATITNVPSRANVTCSVNGQNVNNFSFSGINFTLTGIELQQGNNIVTITGSNNDGSDSKTTVIIYRPQVIQRPPVVTITSPQSNPYNTQNSTENVQATITNVTSRANVTCSVNGQNVNNFSFSGVNFSLTGIQLQQGNNSITITGSNNDGSDSKTTVIIYRPQVVQQPPIVTITYPGTNPYTTQNGSEPVRATIQNVTNRADITCTVNGQNYPSFAFSGVNFTVSSVELQSGNNIVTITARNDAGQDSKTTVIVYNPVVQKPPVVTITAPQANPYNTQSVRETVSATIDYVDSRNDVTCTVNGQTNNAFAFSGNSFTLANLSLQQGNNIITITGRNNVGQDSKTTVIVYNPVVNTPRPIVTITNPNTNPYTTSVQTVNIAASILHVASRNDVTFKVNGATNTNFTFSGTNFTANNLFLNPGNNAITITGRNTTGQDTKSTIIVYNEPVEAEPSVVITSPNQNPFTSTSATVNLVAVIKNVSTRNDVTFTVNGQANNSFSFSGTSFTANNLTLQQGNNSFVITGSNSSGQATASTVVIYNPIQPPVVTFTVPNQNPYNVSSPTTNIAATISNVTSRNDVTLTVNGVNNTSFTYSNNVLALNNITLNQGSNSFTVTGRNAAGQDSKTTVIVYRPKAIPKPIVTITAPSANPYTTQNTTVNISAQILNVESRNDVTFTVNGLAQNNFTFSGTNFTANNINLNPGSNSATITGRNSAGQDTKTTVIIYQAPVQKPIVTITSPNTNPFTTSAQTVNIAATILNVATKNDVTFTVNGQANNNFSFSGTSFSANNIALTSGNTSFTITGRNSAGQDTKTTIVIYQKPVQKPVVTITNPSQNPFNTQTATVNITATILNVTKRADVTFTANGQFNTSFSFNGNSFVANNVTLNPGNNSFTIIGRNSAGQDSKTTVIIYKKPMAPPVVTITNPSQNPHTVTASSININATILNVVTRNRVTFLVNGQVNSNFSFSGTSFSAANVPLQVGNNTIVITGQNATGTDSKTTVIIRNQAMPPPTVQITGPNVSPYTSTIDHIAIKAIVTNVASKNDITFKLNGQNLNFAYSATAFSASHVTLNPGTNTFTITAQNAAGQAAKSTVVIYNPVVTTFQQPGVTINSPTANPFTTATQKVNFSAKITNVSSRNDITFKVNGQVNNNFSFSGTSFAANGVSMNQGNNSILIEAKNGPKLGTASTVVIYNPSTNGGSSGGGASAATPVIKFTNPSISPWISSMNIANVTATVSNVPNKSAITIKVNGVATGAFVYSNNAVSLSNVVLNMGNNTITITAVNQGKTSTKSTIITYNGPTSGKKAIKGTDANPKDKIKTKTGEEVKPKSDGTIEEPKPKSKGSKIEKGNKVGGGK